LTKSDPGRVLLSNATYKKEAIRHSKEGKEQNVDKETGGKKARRINNTGEKKRGGRVKPRAGEGELPHLYTEGRGASGSGKRNSTSEKKKGKGPEKKGANLRSTKNASERELTDLDYKGKKGEAGIQEKRSVHSHGKKKGMMVKFGGNFMRRKGARRMRGGPRLKKKKKAGLLCGENGSPLG